MKSESLILCRGPRLPKEVRAEGKTIPDMSLFIVDFWTRTDRPLCSQCLNNLSWVRCKCWLGTCKFSRKSSTPYYTTPTKAVIIIRWHNRIGVPTSRNPGKKLCSNVSKSWRAWEWLSRWRVISSSEVGHLRQYAFCDALPYTHQSLFPGYCVLQLHTSFENLTLRKVWKRDGTLIFMQSNSCRPEEKCIQFFWLSFLFLRRVGGVLHVQPHSSRRLLP